jgi:hypothetical protein
MPHEDLSPNQPKSLSILPRKPEYRAWESMKRRCYNSNSKDYKYYGGRGIQVCGEWRDSFTTFLADVWRRPSPNHSLDRYPNNNGNYEPGNVRWATRREQSRNRRYNRILEFNGESLPISVWTERLDLPYYLLYLRLRRGWTVKRALSTPVDVHKQAQVRATVSKHSG